MVANVDAGHNEHGIAGVFVLFVVGEPGQIDPAIPKSIHPVPGRRLGFLEHDQFADARLDHDLDVVTFRKVCDVQPTTRQLLAALVENRIRGSGTKIRVFRAKVPVVCFVTVAVAVTVAVVLALVDAEIPPPGKYRIWTTAGKTRVPNGNDPIGRIGDARSLRIVGVFRPLATQNGNAQEIVVPAHVVLSFGSLVGDFYHSHPPREEVSNGGFRLCFRSRF
mmetsp:Transcript_10575/g.30944  ORF Transcript_10575/g.30944 Transcript_10575/m.30944 type:complete len:221 (-) Transcript_10575:859-1521(-)